MSSRSTARPIIISILYAYDINSSLGTSVPIDDIISYVSDEYSDNNPDTDFVSTIVHGVIKKQQLLDEIIKKAAPLWTHDMNMMDKVILRSSIYELLFESEETPAKVIISQAVLLADQYAAPENRRFVNGVLGSVYRELNAEEVSGVKNAAKMTAEGVPLVEKAGGIVFSQYDGVIYLAFVHDIWGYWTIAKGKVEHGESAEQACLREVAEEIGLQTTIVAHLGENIYESRSNSQAPVKNHIHYYLLESEYTELHLETTGGLDDARWVPLGKVDKLRMYDDIAQMLAKAIPLIVQRYQDN